eukprot:gb/GEZN01000583.1/.p1 GENE.gb/GEZN01000583.1/~~gb/GEZN01000583.1/.p1  ORF type:complete len:1193 (-),score=233.63 gb/GEZN01000583.1/:442-4020(-)
MLVSVLLALCAVCTVDAGATSAPWSDRYNPAWRTIGRNKKFDSGQLQVHLVAHTHDDVGWLKTVDQYYVGQNSTIQVAAVQYILSNVLQMLQENPQRKFVYVEQAFFQRWWRQQSSVVKEAMQQVVKNGQLEFLNGGWCMHDEASTHYIGMVDQTTLGHKFLKEQFDVVPRVGWQIDPFGHTSTQASLLSAEVGFDALFFGRIDYQDRQARTNESRLEFVWSASPSLGHSADVWTSSYYTGNYSPMPHFCFDDVQCGDSPVQDDPTLSDYNVPFLVDSFVEQVLDIAEFTNGNHIMLDMGSDFHYQNARSWFENLDKVIKYVNLDGRLSVFYSTPSQYVAAKLGPNDLAWTTKYDDFMPYADCDNCMWSGYFTSRPTLKRYERRSSQLLQALRHLTAWGTAAGNKETQNDGLEELWEAHGVLQHHDGVSGTEKQHVAFDYAARLASGIQAGTEQGLKMLQYLLVLQQPKQSTHPAHTAAQEAQQATYTPHTAAEPWLQQERPEVTTAYLPKSQQQQQQEPGHKAPLPPLKELLERQRGQRPEPLLPLLMGLQQQTEGRQATPPKQLQQQQQAGQKASPPPLLEGLTLCPLLNESNCPVSQQGGAFLVIVYNTRARPVEQLLKVPVDTVGWLVTDAQGNNVPAQQLKNLPSIVPYTSPSAYYLAILAQVPALGYTTYFFAPSAPGCVSCAVLTEAVPVSLLSRKSSSNTRRSEQAVADQAADITIQNKKYSVSFSAETGLLSSLTERQSGLKVQLTQDWMYYRSFRQTDPASTDRQNSGAYVFRPDGNVASRACGQTVPILSVVQGPVLQEVRQELCGWVQQTVRLVAGSAQNSNSKDTDASTNGSDKDATVAAGNAAGSTGQTVELEYQVGTIPVMQDGIGKEVISRFTTNIKNNDTWWTDSNGRELIERRLNYRATWNYTVHQPVAGNYAPVNAAIMFQDVSDGRQFSVLTDRSQGGGSVWAGQLELMAHRRTLADDARGVGEALNETAFISPYPGPERQGVGIGVIGSHYLAFTDKKSGSRLYREGMSAIFVEPLLAFAPLTVSADTFRAKYRAEGSFAGVALPDNVELMSFQPWKQQVLIRVSQQFALGEDVSFSLPVSFDLAAIFSTPFKMQRCQEVSLTANQDVQELKTRRQKYKLHTHEPERRDLRGAPTVITALDPATTSHGQALSVQVYLGPMEIKTFLVTFSA